MFKIDTAVMMTASKVEKSGPVGQRVGTYIPAAWDNVQKKINSPYQAGPSIVEITQRGYNAAKQGYNYIKSSFGDFFQKVFE